MTFAEKIKAARVPENGVAVFWAGQAGFIVKTASGTLIGIDLYLSDCCERYFGFKRILPALLSPYDLIFDFLVCTHAHFDHFDPDAMPMLLDNGHTRLIAAYDVADEVKRLSIPEDRVTYIRTGDVCKCDDVTVKAMPCDHGAETPDAVGLLVSASGKRIYIAGDTCFHADYLSADEIHGVDMAILPINGAYGNLNETEAAKAAALISAHLTVPCHFWNFVEHGGTPLLFTSAMQEYAKDCPCSVMQICGMNII